MNHFYDGKNLSIYIFLCWIREESMPLFSQIGSHSVRVLIVESRILLNYKYSELIIWTILLSMSNVVNSRYVYIIWDLIHERAIYDIMCVL